MERIKVVCDPLVTAFDCMGEDTTDCAGSHNGGVKCSKPECSKDVQTVFKPFNFVFPIQYNP